MPLPDDSAEETDALAKSLGKGTSGVRRQAQIERFAALRRFGRDRAQALGAGADDSEILVDEMRSERS